MKPSLNGVSCCPLNRLRSFCRLGEIGSVSVENDIFVIFRGTATAAI